MSKREEKLMQLPGDTKSEKPSYLTSHRLEMELSDKKYASITVFEFPKHFVFSFLHPEKQRDYRWAMNKDVPVVKAIKEHNPPTGEKE